MTLEISNNRRTEIKKCVISVLASYGKPCVPVKIGDLIRHISYIKLITYSSQIERYHITYNELILSAETTDSYAVWHEEKDRYCIYYNNIEPNIVHSNRVRWNLAHELGHIVLKHHELYKCKKLSRGGLSANAYDYIEAEADYFAQLILVPHVVLYAFKITTARQLKFLCQISNPAAIRRYRDYEQWKQHININDVYDKTIHQYYYNFIYKRHCKNCGAILIQRKGKYCPICGFKSIEWGDGTMNYKEHKINDQGFVKVCIRCENQEIIGDYCHICGAPARNYCTDISLPFPSCTRSEPLPGNARYCPDCGTESLFYQKGLLIDWETEKSTDTNQNIESQPKTRAKQLFTLNDDLDDELPFN